MNSYIYKGPVLIIVAAFLWSLDGFLRQALYSLPATLIVFLEHTLGFVVVVPFLLAGWRQLKSVDRQTWLSVLWVVVWGGMFGTFFYTKALGLVGYIDLSVVVLLQKLQPVFAIGLAMLILKEKPTTAYWRWAIVALIGGYLVTFKDLLPHLSADPQELIAALLAVGAAFAWGSSTVFGRRALEKLDFKLLTSLRFGLTAAILLPVTLVNGAVSELPTVSPDQWLKLAAIVFSTGLVAVIIYYAGLRRTRASIATICEMFWPVSAVVLDYLVNHTVLTATQLIGGALLLVAIYRISRSPAVVEKKQANPQE